MTAQAQSPSGTQSKHRGGLIEAPQALPSTTQNPGLKHGDDERNAAAVLKIRQGSPKLE